jgi:hypothetical protein
MPWAIAKGFSVTIDNLEPATRKQSYYKRADRYQHSIAISLKRIADALTGEGANLLNQPINAYGENIGEAIQGQLERGQR